MFTANSRTPLCSSLKASTGRSAATLVSTTTFLDALTLTYTLFAKDNAIEGFPEPIRPLRTALLSHKRILVGAVEDLCAKFLADLS